MHKTKKKLMAFFLSLIMALALPMAAPAGTGLAVEAKAATVTYSLSIGTKKTFYSGTYAGASLLKSGETPYPQYVQDAYKWKSSDETIIGIDRISDGNCSFKAKRPGTATLTCTYKKKTYTCTITVKRLLKTSSIELVRKGKHFYGSTCKLVKITNTTSKTINLGYHPPESNNGFHYTITGVKPGKVAYMLLNSDEKLTYIYGTEYGSSPQTRTTKLTVAAKCTNKTYTVVFKNNSTDTVWASAIVFAYDTNGKLIAMDNVYSQRSIMPGSKATTKETFYLDKNVGSVKVLFKEAHC